MRTSVVERADLGAVFTWLGDAGYTTVGPTVHDGAIVYAELAGVEDLPVGWGDVQAPGSYRLERREDEALFGFNLPADSWKKYLYPPKIDLVHIRRVDGTLAFAEAETPRVEYAFFGVRPCELAAIRTQDRVFLESGHIDRQYAERRRRALVIGVNCGVASGSCFCASMGTGPSFDDGFDVAITELLAAGRHEFLVEAGSTEGAALVDTLPGRPATADDLALKETIAAETEASMARTMPATDLPATLTAARASDRWATIADRCLSCANCTLVCPTCFCSTVTDSTDLDGVGATRSRQWDSCFTLDFSKVHGNPVRSTTAARYRQWLTHKLATWHDQFDMSGCVGCGRCITWCPVGIDITDEVRALVAEEAAS